MNDFWLHWVFVAAQAFPSYCGQRLLSSCDVWASHRGGFSWGAQALEHVGTEVVGMGLVAPRYVESSQTRDQIRVPRTGRQTPNHWTTREIPG